MSKGFSFVPFIANMSKNQIGDEPVVKKIEKNGKYDTLSTSKVIVKVEGGSGEELTPQAQQEILDELY